MAVLPANYVSVFYMGPTTNTQSYTKCTYMIDQEYSHVVLPDHISISPCHFHTKKKKSLLRNTIPEIVVDINFCVKRTYVAIIMYNHNYT